MKSAIIWAFVSSVTSLTAAIELAPRSANPRVVGLDIGKRHIPNLIEYEKARLLKRQKTVEQVLDNAESLYYANLTLGTPAQPLRLHIDTGSSDLWVNIANSTLCGVRNRCIGGTYNPGASSSYKLVNSNFNITYVDGSNALGDYVTDTMSFGGVELSNFQFGVGRTSSSRQGVLGIGYVTNEVQVVISRGQSYPNLPVALLNAGRINRNAYSLWLNDLDASTGTILFGGVNTAKYQGKLVTQPVYRTRNNQYTAFIIAMTSFGLNGSAITSNNLPAPVLLDSGSTLTRLPDDIVAIIYKAFGVIYDSTAGVGVAYCDLASTKGYLEFGFSGINIQVPFDELFLDAGTDARGNPLTFSNGRRACLFGIAPAQGIIPILGDTFLRSAYVVYDLERNEISLAQTVFNATDNNIQEIASGTSPIPNATPAPSTVRSLALGTATGGAQLGAATGSFTAILGTPSATGTLSGTATRASTSASGSAGSTANAAYATQAPYLVGAALMAGAGLLL